MEYPEVRGPLEEPFAIDLAAAQDPHPLAEPFVGEEALSWVRLAPPQVRGRLAFRETPQPPTPDGEATPPSGAATPAGRVVLRFEDGKPAVVEGALGSGKTLWVATSLDESWFERAMPFFLPVFLDEAAVYLTRPDTARRNLEVGRRILVTWLPRDFRQETFVAPGGLERTPARYEGASESDRPMLIQDGVGTAGVWRLEYDHDGPQGTAQHVVEHFAVNPDPGEGRLAGASAADLLGRLPPESDVRVLTSWGEKVEEATRAEQGEISRLLLWIALGLLALESLVAWLFGRPGAAAGPAPEEAP
jgi:hypothetical protein